MSLMESQAHIIERLLVEQNKDREIILRLRLRVLKWKLIAGLVAIVAVVGWGVAYSVVI